MLRFGARRGFCLAALLAGAALSPALGQPEHSLAEREAVTHERQALRKHIDRIRQEIGEAEKSHARAVDALKASEQAISEATRKLAQIQARGEEAQAELRDLERQIAKGEADMGQRQQALATLLRKQYANGGTTPWSALLSGENPQESGRTLGYLAYVSQARSAAIQAVRDELAQLQTLQASAASRRNELETLAAQAEAQRVERVAQQAERQRVLDDIGIRLAVQRKEASRLETDEERLSGLIISINRALEEQAARRRAEEARLARERELQIAKEREQARLQAERAARELAAREKASRELAAREDAARARANQERLASGPVERGARQQPEDAGDTVLRSSLTERDAPSSQASASDAPAPDAGTPQRSEMVAIIAPSEPPPRVQPVARTAPSVDFADLRGRLVLPARGTLAGRFGQPRDTGGTWRGVFIKTAQATPVQAVAGGTVVFSGWLRGFGNLLIVDHGGEYLSVYGNNEAILKEVGDRVASGETVASAGSSGGQPESGIYFEIRHRGTPVDPLLWAKLR